MRQPTNPRKPRYTVPVGTVGLISRAGSDPKPHRTKQQLTFEYPYSHHGSELPVFRVPPDWLLTVPLSSCRISDHRVIDALLFQIEGGTELICWVDQYGNSKYAHPKRRSHNMLDVEQFHELVWASDRGHELELVVTAVQLYQCSEAQHNGAVITSGRGWLLQSQSLP